MNQVIGHIRAHAVHILLVLSALGLVVGLQSAMFFKIFEARMENSGRLLQELMSETSQRSHHRDIAIRVDALRQMIPAAEPGERTLAAAYSDMREHFSAAPLEALQQFRAELPVAAAGASVEQQQELESRLQEMEAIYTDHFKMLVSDLRSPPAYLWPTAPLLARASDYRQAATFNRAVFLAQTGDIGTARVLLAGLNASAKDQKVLADIYYTLGRLQFELFRTTQEAEYFSQSLQYLRKSLASNSGQVLAKRLLDYLLSLSQAATAPQSAEGRPETPSEGAGAAISAEKRVF